jgi:hypothetical protein
MDDNCCAEIPIDPARERDCRAPWYWDDGVPYCEICGLFRATVASGEHARLAVERAARTRKRM